MPHFVDHGIFDSKTARILDNGCLVGQVRCARTGVQTYLRRELGLEGAGTINVMRPEKSVFDADSLRTYANKPVTIGHPKKDVTAATWKDDGKGIIGSEVLRDGEFVSVPIMIMDADSIDKAQTTHQEVSMGYDAEVTLQDGVHDGTAYEAVIGPPTINHLAFVPKARGGDKLRLGDGLSDEWGASPVKPAVDASLRDNQGTKPMKTVIHDGITIEGPDQIVDAYNVMKKRLDDQASAAKAKEEELTAKLKDADVALAKAEAAVDDAKSKIVDAAALDEAVAARADLINLATAIDPSVKTTGLSDSAIRKAVVTAKIGDAAIAGKSDAYIEARFDGLAESVTENGKLRDGISTFTMHGNDAGLADAEKIEETSYNKTLARFDRSKKSA